jgi:hypothetical protein
MTCLLSAFRRGAEPGCIEAGRCKFDIFFVDVLPPDPGFAEAWLL